MNLLVLGITAVAWALGVFPGPIGALWPVGGVIVIFFLSDWGGASRWCQQLCLALSGTLFALSLADVGVRVAGIHRWNYRPEEVLLERSRQWRSSYRFRPGQQLEMSSWGDLSNLACDPEAREARKVAFQTDSLGFRNSASGEPYDTILLGDSFTYGSGTTQSETWSEELRRAGVASYNMGMPGSPVQAVANFIHTRPKLPTASIKDVVYILFEGNDFDWELALDPLSPLVSLSSVERWSQEIAQLQANSPIRRMARVVWGGCPTADSVFRRRLSPGGELLFYRPYDKATRMTTAELSGSPGWTVAASAIRMLSEVINKEPGVRLRLILVPTKEHVYLYPNTPAAAAPLLSRLAEELSVPFTDATDTFLAEARQLLQSRGDLLWWRDDTHWNPNGHQVMTKLLISQLGARHPGAIFKAQ
jgi:hypothetical protein